MNANERGMINLMIKVTLSSHSDSFLFRVCKGLARNICSYKHVNHQLSYLDFLLPGDSNTQPSLSLSFVLYLFIIYLSISLYLSLTHTNTHTLTLFYSIVWSLTEGISRSKDNVFSVLHDENLLSPTPPPPPVRFISFICGLWGSVV